MPIERDPPLPPSPMTTAIVGELWLENRDMVVAIECARPLFSAPKVILAPGVSISEIIGKSNFSAILMALCDFLNHSGIIRNASPDTGSLDLF